MKMFKNTIYPLGSLLLPKVSLLLDSIRVLFLAIPFVVLASSCGRSGQKAEDKVEEISDKVEARVDTMRQDIRENRDDNFVQEAAKDNQHELQLLNIVGMKAMSKELKKHAAMMKKDHEKVAVQLTEYAAAHNIRLNIDTNSIPGIADEKSGAEWDKDAVDKLVDAHEHAISYFEKIAEKAENADLKTWATGTLPTLRSHLTMMQELQTKMK